ncbi:hypothetical protein RAD15_15505 [Bradyrhizobium sp. 14AA]
MRSLIKKIPALRRAYYRHKMRRPQSQSNETVILDRLAERCEKTFVEFGFHPAEFNCASLARRPDWRGLLIDGNRTQVEDAKALLPPNVEAVHSFLSLENIGSIASHFRKIGVLSIDVDGNDYWFLKALIDSRPDVISVEYNSTFGVEPISVPYDPAFDRHQKHSSGWYHGASLTALAGLCRQHGYGLAAISDNGGNAFFTPDGTLDPIREWRPSTFRQSYSGIAQPGQWEAVKSLPYIRV